MCVFLLFLWWNCDYYYCIYRRRVLLIHKLPKRAHDGCPCELCLFSSYNNNIIISIHPCEDGDRCACVFGRFWFDNSEEHDSYNYVDVSRHPRILHLCIPVQFSSNNYTGSTKSCIYQIRFISWMILRLCYENSTLFVLVSMTMHPNSTFTWFFNLFFATRQLYIYRDLLEDATQPTMIRGVICLSPNRCLRSLLLLLSSLSLLLILWL